jgi:hypothetical protein
MYSAACWVQKSARRREKAAASQAVQELGDHAGGHVADQGELDDMSTSAPVGLVLAMVDLATAVLLNVTTSAVKAVTSLGVIEEALNCAKCRHDHARTWGFWRHVWRDRCLV